MLQLDLPKSIIFYMDLKTMSNMKKQDHPASSSNLISYADMLNVSHGLTLASPHFILKMFLKKLSL